MTRLYYDVKFSGHDGRRRGDNIQVMQNAIETPLVFQCSFEDGEAYTFETGDLVTAKFVDVAGTAYTSTGTITPSDGTNEFVWVRTVEDVGLPDTYKLTFEVIHASGESDYSTLVDYVIVAVPGEGITPPSPMVGVTVAQAAWLAVAVATVPDASDLITSADVSGKADKDTDATVGNLAEFDIDGNPVDSGSAVGDFDTAGSAAAVAGDLSTHEGLTGTAVHGLGTAATSAATDFVAVAGDTMTGPLSITGSTSGSLFSATGSTSGALGLNFSPTIARSSTSYAIYSEPSFAPTGNTSTLYGYIVIPRLKSSTFNVATLRGVSPSPRTSADYTGTLGVSQAIFIDPSITNFLGSVPANLYGIYIDNQTSGTSTNHAIYTRDGKVSFGDVLELRAMKSGATQAAAGAAAGELWKTAGHATLPDNVVLHGV